MKLSKREKNMLVISAILLLCFAMYFLVVTPIHTEYDLRKTEYDSMKSRYTAVNSVVLTDDQMDGIIVGYRDQISVLESQLPSVIHLEEIINLMFNHFNDFGITVNSITFNMMDQQKDSDLVEDPNDDRMGIEKLQPPMSVEEILDEYENSAELDTYFDVSNQLEGDVNYDNISYMSISLAFESNYLVLKDVLEGLETLDITAVTNDINITKNVDVEEDDNNEVVVSLSISIPFYYDNEKQKDYIFDYSFNKGEDYIEHGPFEYDVIENLEDALVVPEKDEIDQISISPEFYVSLNSKASDLPAQSMSYYGMNNSELNLNSDKNERYDLTLTQENDEVYFNYKNSNTSYPSGTSSMIVNQKNDAIIIKVFSSNRISESDNASMTLVLNNETNKKVLFYVFYDDKEKPRFNVIVNKGNFDVIRN